MIDSNFRSPYQKLIIHPLLNIGWIKTLSPVKVTLAAALFGALIPLFLYYGATSPALICLGLSGFCDTLDGSLARAQGTPSPKGAVLDIVSDRFVELAIIIGLYLYAPEGRALLSLFMLGSVLLCITTFLVVGIFQENASEKSFHYSPGLIERGEAFLFFALMILFPSLFTPLTLLFGGLTLITAIIRTSQFVKVNY